MKDNKYINVRAQRSYEPKSPKLLWTWDPQKIIKHKTQTQKKRTPLRPQYFAEFKEHVWTQHQIFNEPKAPKNLRPQKGYEPKGPKPSWTQDKKRYESKGTRCLPANRQKMWTQGPQNSTSRRRIAQHVLRMHLGGGAAPYPPTPLQLFFF